MIHQPYLNLPQQSLPGPSSAEATMEHSLHAVQQQPHGHHQQQQGHPYQFHQQQQGHYVDPGHAHQHRTHYESFPQQQQQQQLLQQPDYSNHQFADGYHQHFHQHGSLIPGTHLDSEQGPSLSQYQSLNQDAQHHLTEAPATAQADNAFDWLMQTQPQDHEARAHDQSAVPQPQSQQQHQHHPSLSSFFSASISSSGPNHADQSEQVQASRSTKASTAGQKPRAKSKPAAQTKIRAGGDNSKDDTMSSQHQVPLPLQPVPPPSASASSGAQDEGEPELKANGFNAESGASSAEATAISALGELGTPTPARNGRPAYISPFGKHLGRNRACAACRDRKLKCDGAKPVCSQCQRAWDSKRKGKKGAGPQTDGLANCPPPPCVYMNVSEKASGLRAQSNADAGAHSGDEQEETCEHAGAADEGDSNDHVDGSGPGAALANGAAKTKKAGAMHQGKNGGVKTGLANALAGAAARSKAKTAKKNAEIAKLEKENAELKRKMEELMLSLSSKHLDDSAKPSDGPIAGQNNTDWSAMTGSAGQLQNSGDSQATAVFPPFNAGTSTQALIASSSGTVPTARFGSGSVELGGVAGPAAAVGASSADFLTLAQQISGSAPHSMVGLGLGDGVDGIRVYDPLNPTAMAAGPSSASSLVSPPQVHSNSAVQVLDAQSLLAIGTALGSGAPPPAGMVIGTNAPGEIPNLGGPGSGSAGASVQGLSPPSVTEVIGSGLVLPQQHQQPQFQPYLHQFAAGGLTFTGWPVDFPPPEKFDKLVEVFFKYIGSMWPMLHRGRFYSRLALGPLHARYPHYAVLHAMFALAYTMMPELDDSPPPALPSPTAFMARGALNGTGRRSPAITTCASFHSDRAKAIVGGSMEGQNVYELCQASVLLAIYKYANGELIDAWMLSAQCLRIAVPLGLSRMAPESSLAAREQQQQQQQKGGESFTDSAQPSPQQSHLGATSTGASPHGSAGGAGPKSAGSSVSMPSSRPIHVARLTIMPPAMDWVDEEERRRTFWLAYICDRNASSATLWAPSLAEEVVKTDFPVTDLRSFWSSDLTSVAPLNRRQTLASYDLFTDGFGDSFQFQVKSSMLYYRCASYVGKMNDFVSMDDYVTADYHRLNLDIEHLIASIPVHLQDILQPCVVSDTIDGKLVLAHMLPLSATLVLNQPLIDLSNEAAARVRVAVTNMLRILELLASSGAPLTHMPPVFSYLVCNVGRNLIRGWKEMRKGAPVEMLLTVDGQIGEPIHAAEAALRKEIDLVFFALCRYGQRWPLGMRQAQVMAKLMGIEMDPALCTHGLFFVPEDEITEAHH
ncbi:hypothetical protein OC845_004088 [Tilletia horrida]|nr:hypothetical protein OC845_004088 [Tilletia horrida]